MKNFVTISVYCLIVASLYISWLPVRKKNTHATNLSAVKLPGAIRDNNYSEEKITSLYTSLKLERKGLSKQAFQYACRGYDHLLKRGIIKHGHLVICDFSQSSNRKRLYLIDMTNNEVALNTFVAHGRNSGGEYAKRFSNKLKSLQSSLGFYVTQKTYYGEHGLSLRVEGLEKGYNDKANQRRIVIHGADYIGDAVLKSSNYMGRSYGCPAIPTKESKNLINTIKNGSCIFIYHPSANYLKGSKILNG
ncbi:MAG: murein L,D-transpeptidase catalytic domain family protein [Chitinophagaceae bacterium]